MKKLIYSLAIVSFLSVMTSCDKDLEEINVDPNNPVNVPTSGLFNSANKYFVDNTRGGFPSGRMLLPFAQMSSQREYNEEERYAIRVGTNNNYYNAVQLAVRRYKSIIEVCEDPELSGKWAGVYGDIQNQIAAARIMIAYAQLQLVGTYGDVSYYSYGSDDPDFQGQSKGDDIEYSTPVFAPQDKIYKDLMKELKEAAEQINLADSKVMEGDHIFGTPEKMQRFANSLRLRIANRVKHVIPEAQAHIDDAIASGVMQSNDDNVGLTYENNSINPAPWYKDAFVGNRNDFSPADTFLNLVKGETGPFGVDPRLYVFAAPYTNVLYYTENKKIPISQPVAFYTGGMADKVDDNGKVILNPDGTAQKVALRTIQAADYDNYYSVDSLYLYRGAPYGIGSADSQVQGSLASQFGSYIYKANYTEIMMEYAEVEFLLSENKGWDDSHYKNGVRASMEKFGIESAKIDAYINTLPAANQETVISQKYISLFLQPEEAWAEYRRTGYPNTLILPGQTGKTIGTAQTPSVDYVFKPAIVIKGIPQRMNYPTDLQSLNKDNLEKAISKLEDGDTMDSPLIFTKK
ncbi:SusD/RagB family nutrient-binding outer membrane lipoprotein [Myroides sp. LJL119]